MSILFDFCAHGTLEATGDDARTFLHNLSTNDIKTLPEWHGREAFFLTATAKAVGQAWIWRQPPAGKTETLTLDTPPGQAAKLFLHLRRFIIGEDVELRDRTMEYARLYLSAGRDVFETNELTFRPAEGGVVIRRRDLLGGPGYDFLGPPDEIADVRATLLAAGAEAGDDETFHVRRVEAGLAWYGIDIDESTFGPETGRIAQAISYNKGCYLGQEPVVMARDRGVIQRTLVGLELGETPIKGPLLKDAAEVGRVTSAVFSPRLGRAIGLGYAKRGSQAPGTELRVGDRVVKVAALPFG